MFALFRGGIVIMQWLLFVCFLDPQIISTININKLECAWESERGREKSQFRNSKLLFFRESCADDITELSIVDSALLCVSTFPELISQFNRFTNRTQTKLLNVPRFYFHQNVTFITAKWQQDQFLTHVNDVSELAFHFSPLIWWKLMDFEEKFGKNKIFSIITVFSYLHETL